MSPILTLAGVAMVVCLLAVLVQKHAPTQGFLLTLGGLVVLFGMASTGVAQLEQAVAVFSPLLGGDVAYFLPVLRAVGIAITCRVTGGLCKDAGQSALATALDILGTVATLLVCLPLFTDLFALVQGIAR